MSKIMDGIFSRAKALNKHIVLPEGLDERVINAAITVAEKKLAKITIIGDEKIIAEKSKGQSLKGVNIINPKTSPKTKEYAKLLYELRKSKGMTEQEAEKTALDEVFFGVLMLKNGDADGLVSGAAHSTADTLRPGLQIVKTAPNASFVSSYFLMVAPENCEYCKDGAFIYSDCGLMANPTAEELAEIAVISAKTAELIAHMQPRVAMLSFSTKGSAKHADIDKVITALNIVKSKAPHLNIDGELQLDAAIVPKVAKSKAPGSSVAGNANVLIFPDLDAGNIGYKLTERLGGFQAIGPLCQGFAKPINDLSRGCNADDIVAAVAITALQTQL